MSGGSMDYLCYKVESANFRMTTALRRAFYMHLQNVAKALHAIEWNDSGDGDDSEDAAIAQCVSAGDVLTAGIDQAEAPLKNLQDAMRIASEMRK